MRVIPYGRQSINDDDIQAVVEVLKSEWLTQGPAVDKFEIATAEYVGSKYAVAVNSGTSALHLACRAMGLGEGGLLWTTPNTFVASANCALYCGANIDFVDIEPDSFNMSPGALEKKLFDAESCGKLPDIVVPVHFAGQPCDMEEISVLARKYGFKVIEDACHALGSEYQESRSGDCRYSDVTIFSFHPVKLVTTGEGGMIATDNKELHEKLLLLRSHGITRDDQQMSGESHGAWYYQQVDLGYNYRMTDIQAALGISQLLRLDNFISNREELARRYNEKLVDLPISLPGTKAGRRSAWHLYVIRVDAKKAGKTRKQVFESLRDNGIGVSVHYIPVHTQPYFRKLGFNDGDYPISEEYYSMAISIPIYHGMTLTEQDEVVGSLKSAL